MHFLLKSVINVLLLLVAFLSISAAYADARTIKVGIYDYKPLVYQDSDSTPHGFFIDVLNHIAINENWSLQYSFGTWKEVVDRLDRGEIDLLACVGYNDERAKRYDFTAESLLTDWGTVFRHSRTSINTIMDMEGLTVAGLKGSIYTLGFQQLASQFNVSVNLLEKDTLQELFAASNDPVDAVVTGNLAGSSYTDDRKFKRTPINYSPVKLGFVTLKGQNSDILSVLSQRIKELKADSNSIFFRKHDEMLSVGGRKILSPPVIWGFFTLAGALLISITFVITLTRMVRRKTANLENYSREISLSEERFRLAMDASRDGLWDWNILTGDLYLSPGYFRMLGYEPFELTPELSTWFDRVHPDDHDNAMSANTECVEGLTESFAVEFRMLAKNGSWRWILNRGAAVTRQEDGRALRIIGTNTDITNLVAAKIALKQSEERLKLAASAAHLGVWDWDLQKSLLEWDARVFEIYGITPSSSKSMKQVWENSIHEDDRDEVISKLNSALRTGSFFEIEYRIVRDDGTIRTIKSFATILRENGTAVRMTGVDLDVTDRRILEQQIRHTQKMDAIGRLAGGIAHDFNNKLTVILGYAELMKMLDCASSGRCEQHLGEIIKAANHSQEITRKLLTFSRDDAAESCRVDVNHMLKEMKRTLGRLIGEQIVINFSLIEEIWSILINPTEYDQIIMNLVVNARDAMPHGGSLTITTGNVTVRENVSASLVNATHGDYVVTSVTDSGCGIAKNIIDRIFDPFFTTKEAGKGTGLGLSTVYGIVLKYGGFISVKSDPGKGSTFSIYLPKYTATSSAIPSVEEPVTVQGKGKILLVEDEEAVRNMIELFLESVGFSVIVAKSPEDAVEICRNTWTIDCVLSDVIMPGLNGKQLSEKIRAIRPELPFVFMSGYTSDIITEQGITGEGLHFIRKPLNFKDLKEKLLSAMLQEKPE